MGIKLKLLSSLAAALIPMLAVGTISIHLLDRQLSDTTKTALSNTQRLEAARISQILSEYANEARSLAAGSHVRSFVAATNSYLNSGSNQDAQHYNLDLPIGGYDGFAIVDPDSPWPLQQLALRLQKKAGMVESSIVQVRLVDRRGTTLGESIGFSWEPSDTELMEHSMQTVKTKFGDAFRNDSGLDKLGIVSPIISTEGKVVGALLVENQLGPIVNLIAKHEGVGYSSEAHIAQATTEGNAQFITPLRFDRNAAFNKVVSKEQDMPVLKALQSEESVVLKAADYRGVESYLAVQTIPKTGWGLIVKIDAEEAFAPVTALRNNLIYATLASAALILCIYLFWLMPIAIRLKRTVAAARKIRNGDLTSRIRDEHKDEISEMASSINSLAYDLEQDQKKRSEVEAQLRHQALHDELTGLLNRKHANTVINNLQDDRQTAHTVMFLDLNGFKDVNDLYGHSAGDKVLKAVAERLTSEIPEGSTLARWGGDEFVVILPETDEAQATQLALTLHDVLDEPIATGGDKTHRISCSIGLATSNNLRSLEDALIEADALMYEQKKRQRNDRSKSGLLARGVERALNEERMEVWYQPMLSTENIDCSQLTGADTQLRLRSSDGGYVLPTEYRREVDNDRIAIDLDRRLINLSLQALNRWAVAGIVTKNFRMKIRLTHRTLNDAAFPILLHNELGRFKVLPTQIIFEIPANYDALDHQVLSQLRGHGFSVAINCDQAEPEVLQLLSKFHPDITLIDKIWHAPSATLLTQLIAVCQDLDIDLLARNVESHEQLLQLNALGISRFQGTVFEGPLPAVDFISRWGQTRLKGLGKMLSEPMSLSVAV